MWAAVKKKLNSVFVRIINSLLSEQNDSEGPGNNSGVMAAGFGESQAQSDIMSDDATEEGPDFLGESSVSDYIAILLSFPHDKWTDISAIWMRKIADSQASRVVSTYSLISNDVSRTDVAKLLASVAGSAKVEIFCGHGDYHALLGPPQADPLDTDIGDASYGIIYSRDMITPSPGSMFAFCCRAARNFGRVFGAYRGKAFLGFNDDIHLIFDDDFIACLEEIFCSVCESILRKGGILAEHEALLRTEYRDAINHYRDGSGRKTKRSFLKQLYLAEHMRVIRRYGNPVEASAN